MAKPAPEVIHLSPAQLEDLVAQLRVHLPASLFELVHTALQTLQWVLGAMEHKTTTIARLKRVLFGSRSEKTAKLFPPPPATVPEADPQSVPPADKPKRRGHGRHGAGRYTGAHTIRVPHPHLRAGDPCPECTGTLAAKTPARVVCIHAQPMFTATCYEATVLRCNRCQKVFTAPLPPEAQLAKYDPNVGDMLAITRYGMGVPMYRTARAQQDLGVPLLASTQWELMAQAAEPRRPVYEAMIEAAAQAPLIHTDDTTMRVQSLRREIAQAGEEAKRTGIFTTNLIADLGDAQVALYFTGSEHAGENLDRVLQHRAAGLERPLHMCDALSRNESQEFETILCNCLTHGRRQFTDVHEGFPEECRQVIESLREVYRCDAQARAQGLSDAQRLGFHQEHSGPVMEVLHGWMSEQLAEKRVEPNSGLGQAIQYMLKRWESLTRFLEVPGAPLDNNICERGLKMAILHRKNSLSYKTLRGAKVGDIFMSLIHTCRLNAINPVEYLTALRDHAGLMFKHPSQWLPWTFRQTLQALDTD